MKRRIHLVSTISCLITYITIFLIVFAYLKTTGIARDYNGKGNIPDSIRSTYKTWQILSIIVMLLLSFFAIITIGSGVSILIRLEESPNCYRTLNILIGIMYIIGGVIFAPFFSLYLYIKE